MKSILDPTFQYTPSFDTDLRRTFARLRREHPPEAKRSAHATENESASRVVSLDDACRWRTVAIGNGAGRMGANTGSFPATTRRTSDGR